MGSSWEVAEKAHEIRVERLAMTYTLVDYSGKLAQFVAPGSMCCDEIVANASKALGRRFRDVVGDGQCWARGYGPSGAFAVEKPKSAVDGYHCDKARARKEYRRKWMKNRMAEKRAEKQLAEAE